MEDYGDRVIEMILIEGSSHEICAALHLCLFGQTKLPASQSGLLMPGPVLIESSVGGDDPKCVICEYVIQTLAERMKDNATEVYIFVNYLVLNYNLNIVFHPGRDKSGTGTNLQPPSKNYNKEMHRFRHHVRRYDH